ncbi:hypothetical protein RU01_18580 [Rhodococcus sp. MEB064]|nr:hypothetical protein RU01_18580 [Rhodococcus sp. MEB064]
MTAVFGISVGSTSLRLVRTDSEAISAGVVSFEMKVVHTYDRPSDRDVVDSVYSLPAEPGTPAAVTVASPDHRVPALTSSLAGDVNGVRVVDDTLAALAFVDFAWLADGYRTFALVDVGATKSSVTIVDSEARRRTETRRSTAAAGRALDRIVVDHMIDADIVDRPATDDAEREMFAFARSVKESLSDSVLARASGGEIELMSRARLEELSTATVTACVRNVVDAALDCGAAVEVVILVGGTARMPLVRAMIEESLGVPVVVPDEPEAVVAKGAGLIAGTPFTPDDLPDYVVSAQLGDALDVSDPDTSEDPGSSSDAATTEAMTTIVTDDIPVAPPESLLSVTSPYDSPTRPFVAVDDSPTPHTSVVETDGESASDRNEETESRKPSSMRIPRAAAMLLTALAVASGVLWAVVRPGVDVEPAPAAVSDIAADVATTTPAVTTSEPPRITVATTTEPATTTESAAEEPAPVYVPPRTSTRAQTFDDTPPAPAPSTVDVAPTVNEAPPVATSTVERNPLQQLPVPQIFQDLPIPGF